jgi:ribosomal protein L11 methyltransferase
VDYNPNAAATVYKNAELNGIKKDTITVYTDDIFQNHDLRTKIGAQKYDCIVANIVADAIIDLSPMLAGLNCLKTEGVFITSGIISERQDEVVSALTATGFNIIETQSENEWICLASIG